MWLSSYSFSNFVWNDLILFLQSSDYLKEVICGNIVIANSNEEGETVGLTDEDIALIQSSTKIIDKPNLGFSSNFGDITLELNSEVLLYDF